MPYEKYDLIIDNNTEHLKEELYGSRSVTISLLQTLLARIIFNRPLVTTPTSVGPFNNKLNKWLARKALNGVKLLALRESGNEQYCNHIGLDKPKIYFVSDPAFLMEPAEQDVVDSIILHEGITKTDKPLVGVSPNWLEMTRFSFGKSVNICQRKSKYIQLMAEITDHVVDTLNANVWLIPHALGGLLSTKENDDREVCRLILTKVKNKRCVKMFIRDYAPDELKGIIGNCDMFIGCRMHATIASTSLGVPTITIAYGDKYFRIIGDTMGQNEYIIDLRQQSYDKILVELKLKIQLLWENRREVSTFLLDRSKLTKKIALNYPQLLQNIVEKSQ